MTDSLAAIRCALANAATRPVDIVCVGDSLTEGMIAPHREEAWPQRLRDLLRGAVVTGGIGYCPSYSVSASVGDFWRRDGDVAEAGLATGLGRRCLKAPNGSSVALGFTGTGLDLLTTTGLHSALAYTLDGGPAVTVDQRHPDPIQSGVVIPIRGLSDGAHTITVSGTAMGSAYVEGAMVYRGDEERGIRVWESGHSGSTCADYTATDRWHGSFRAVPHPALVIVLLGANEYNQAITSAQYGRDLGALLDTISGLLAGKDCSVLVISPHQRKPLSGRANQSYYEAQAANAASERGFAYLSMTPAIGPWQAAQAAGLLQDGQAIHPTSAGHALYAGAIAKALLP